MQINNGLTLGSLRILGTLYADTIKGLANYSKATAASAITTTDLLDEALAKLEYKSDYILNLITETTDDSTINRLQEVYNFLKGITGTETMSTLLNKYLLLTGGTLTGALTTTSTIYINNDTDVGLNQSGSLVIGAKTGLNIGIDANEIMARNNSAAAMLYLNWEGGLVGIGSGGLQVKGDVSAVRLSVDANKYFTNNTYGIFMNNSDITGANAIYFGDALDSAEEGISFVNGSNYDTIWDNSGKLYYAPNHSKGAATNNYEIWHENNYATSAHGSALIATLSSGTGDVTDSTTFITSDNNGTLTLFYRRPATSLWNYILSKDGTASTLDADLLDGKHASYFRPIVGEYRINTNGTAPYNYLYLCLVANTNGYSTVSFDLDFKSRNHRGILHVDIATPQYTYNAATVTMSTEGCNGRTPTFYYVINADGSTTRTYDIYVLSGAWNSGSYHIISKGSNGNLSFTHVGTNVDTLPDGYVTIGATLSNINAATATLADKATADASGNTITSTYLKLSGGTMTGALNFKNGTWNLMGDDAYIGDYNQAGAICIKGNNGATSLYFAPYSGSTAQKISIDGSGTMTISGTQVSANIFKSTVATGTSPLTIASTTKVDNLNADLLDGLHAGYRNGEVLKIVEWPHVTSLITLGYLESEYTSNGYPFENFLKAICKWAIDNLTNQGYTLIGSATPSSRGFIHLNLYTGSGKDSTTSLPRYCSGVYYSLNGFQLPFGTVDYVWYYGGTYYGNATTSTSATTASKLSTVSKTAWGLTYWTSDGVPTSISGNMTGVGSITANGDNIITKTSGETRFRATNHNGSIDLLTSTNRGLYDATTGVWVVGTNGTNTWMLRGNVGIGILTPSYKLHVYGGTLGQESSVSATYNILTTTDGTTTTTAQTVTGTRLLLIYSGANTTTGTVTSPSVGNLNTYTTFSTNATYFHFNKYINQIINYHVGNNVNYPIVWCNSTSTSSAGAVLYKSTSNLYFNTYSKILTSTGGFNGPLRSYNLTPRLTSADITSFADGGLRTYLSSSSMTTSKPTIGDGSIIHMSWDNTGGWDTQIAVSHGTTHMLIRSLNAAKWGSWINVIDETNEYTTNVTTIALNGVQKTAITPTTTWQNTGITNADLPAGGTYIVLMYVHDTDDYQWYMFYSGVMSWNATANNVNDTDSDEIQLHAAGHAYGKRLYLRTLSHSSSDSDSTVKGKVSLLIAADLNFSGTQTITFKFKRII